MGNENRIVDNKITVIGQQQIYGATGTPNVEINGDGELQIHPTGVMPGALLMSLTVADWRALNEEVEAAISRWEAGGRPKDIGGVIPLRRRT